MRFQLTILSILILTASYSQTVNDLRPTVTMKEYVDMQAQLNRELAKVQFENIEKNVAKANEANDKRLDVMNEFRGTIEDSNSTYVTWPALLGLIVGVSGFIFGYANFQKVKSERENAKSNGKNIVSGDKVEVKK